MRFGSESQCLLVFTESSKKQRPTLTLHFRKFNDRANGELPVNSAGLRVFFEARLIETSIEESYSSYLLDGYKKV
jgi:hypothetical protein